jgi:hypothetical protein
MRRPPLASQRASAGVRGEAIGEGFWFVMAR